MAAAAASTAGMRFCSWISSPKVSFTDPEFRVTPLVRAIAISLKFSPAPLTSPIRTRRRPGFLPCSVVQEAAVDQKEAVESAKNSRDEEVNRTKLYVVNLPWDYSASDLENLFSQFGAVAGVEIVKQKNGKSRGFAFVAMSSEEEAQVALDKLNSFELSGRIIRVELAKNFKKPSASSNVLTGESRNWIYVSNLAWKVRSSELREFFSVKFKPVSARVIFEGQSSRSAGYGFISFTTSEEALAAISELDGKELMGRPLALKISQKGGDEPDATPKRLSKGQL